MKIGKSKANWAVNYYFGCFLCVKHYQNANLTKPIKHATSEFATTVKISGMGSMVSWLILLARTFMKHYDEVLISWTLTAYFYFVWLLPCSAQSGGSSLSEKQFHGLFSSSLVPQAVLTCSVSNKRKADFLLRFLVVVIQLGHFRIIKQFSVWLVKRQYSVVCRCGNLDLELMYIP